MLPNVRTPEADLGGVNKLAVLGSTGSIGTQCLDIARMHPERVRVSALTAGRNVAALAKQALEFRPELAAIADESLWPELNRLLQGSGVRAAAGPAGLAEAAALDGVNTVLAAIVGYAGLESTLEAIRRGRRIALANKETLVVAGEAVSRAVASSGSEVIPVDSEHSAIFQCLLGEPPGSVERLLLTASGGPFRQTPVGEFDAITPEHALRHPNWDMGAKITIDSATMMNKGLEVIEARWMFGVQPDRIEVVVHPESIIHSMVQFHDGSTKAQLGIPDMKVPIQYALSYPGRWPAAHPRVDWSLLGSLTFEPPDHTRFPCLGLAYAALDLGGTAPAVLNAANEVAVARFLAGRLSFTGIPALIERTMTRLAGPGTDLASLMEADREARVLALELAPATVHSP